MFRIFFYKFENILPGMRRIVNISTLMVFRNQRRRRTPIKTGFKCVMFANLAPPFRKLPSHIKSQDVRNFMELPIIKRIN